MTPNAPGRRYPAAPGLLIRRIVAQRSAERLVAACVRLAVPAAAVLEIRRTVLVDQADLTLESVILQGRLRVTYLLAPRASGPEEADKSAQTQGKTAGPVVAQDSDLPFLVHIPVPGAEPGMSVQVTEAFVSGAAALPAGEPGNALRALAERSIIFLAVRVTTDEQVEAVRGSTAPPVEPVGPPEPVGPT